MKTRDVHGLEKQRFRDRRSTELRPLSAELQALIGTPVPGKAKLPRVKKNKLVAKAQDRVAKEPRHTPSKDEKQAFYACCGATPRHLTLGGQPVRLVVDHIRPLGTHWHLRLEAENLQVLCDDCNMGKGGVHIEDFR